jgi:hypothetical protein
MLHFFHCKFESVYPMAGKIFFKLRNARLIPHKMQEINGPTNRRRGGQADWYFLLISEGALPAESKA